MSKHPGFIGCILALAFFAGPVSAGDGENRWVSFKNNSSYDVVELYASSAGVREWQEDILGRDILPAGEEVDVLVDDGSGACIYDIKVVFSDGDTSEKRGFDVCAEAVIFIND